ncbi:MAG TPA: tyrosine-type recombinase/integrase [Gracilimonas sp.]|uniref:tyrosine-type recombinase/integrase n=1 Tax=Gracilimonas sp. TaxID=1974203 RepID=UPI002D88194F|nr:tyrosine-type recombinase/integrase [Gracilimonas sp.]
MKAKIPTVNLRPRRDKKSGKITSWFLDFRINGSRERPSLGSVSKNEAIELQNKFIQKLKTRSGIEYVPENSISLSAAIEMHISEKEKSVKERTLKRYKARAQKIEDAIDAAGRHLYNDISLLNESTFELIVEEIKKANKSQHSVYNLTVFLKAVENTAVHKRYMNRKVSTKIKAEKPARGLDVKFFSPEELKLIWKHSDPFYEPYFKFILCTGLRLGEFVNLRWSDVNLDGNKIKIDIHRDNEGNIIWEPKTKGSVRFVPLNAEAKQIILAQQGKDSVYVFTAKDECDHAGAENLPGAYTGGQLHEHTVYNNLKAALKKAGIDQDKNDNGMNSRAVHTLRHTFASQLAQSGMTLDKIGQFLGHSKYETTLIYSHLAPSLDAELLDVIST